MLYSGHNVLENESHIKKIRMDKLGVKINKE